MKDTVAESQDSVPGLGSIPVIGNLFKSRSSSRQKTNLLVFLRPKILRDQRATEETSTSRYNEIRGEEESLHKGKITLLPGEKQPAIPPIPPGNSPAPQPAPTGAIALDPQPVLPASQRAAGTTQPVSPSQTDPVPEHAPER